MTSSFYTAEELKALGLKSFGDNVFISRKCSIYGAENITIGHHVRIDDFCILSGSITIGNYVHIAASSFLFSGDAGIEMQDFSGISSRCVLYAMTDDYTGIAMTNPTIPDAYRHITKGKILLKKHSIIGTGTTILPNVIIEEGTSVGAMSLVIKPTKPWKVYFGIPARPIMDRNKKILELEKHFLEEKS